MKKYKYLYKVMYDDLKDANMLIDYACEIKEEDSSDIKIFEMFVEYASLRLKHFMEFHKLFQEEIAKYEDYSENNIYKEVWQISYKLMQEWYESINNKLEKIK